VVRRGEGWEDTPRVRGRRPHLLGHLLELVEEPAGHVLKLMLRDDADDLGGSSTQSSSGDVREVPENSPVTRDDETSQAYPSVSYVLGVVNQRKEQQQRTAPCSRL
jgi:hypothetical protein